jgi:hypothetical protein
VSIPCEVCGRLAVAALYTRFVEGQRIYEAHWMCPCGAHGRRPIDTVKVRAPIL